jgi:hypothetical protein
MARKSRLNPGGYAYGELTAPPPGQEHRDAPLSSRGRLIWRLSLLATGALFAGIIVAILLSR